MLVVEYANSAKLYVPLDQAWQVSRYVGWKEEPRAFRAGRCQVGAGEAESAEVDFRLRRQHAQDPGRARGGSGLFSSAGYSLAAEFEDAFPYKETADQVRAIGEAKHDMESAMPMDRLVCGDVGFGKTEVAIRAVFKAVMSGKQVAVLAPTTVLAQQHFQNFRERMSEYPVNVELLSRTGPPQNKRRSCGVSPKAGWMWSSARIAWSRLMLHFKDIGLVVVDEEQRFG